MPIYYHSPSRKVNGFSIDNIIKNDDLSNTSNRLSSSSSYVPSIPWLPPLTNTYQFQRESMLQYLRHINQFTHSGMAAAFLFNSYRKPKRNRTAFTPSQLLKLENAFEKNHYIVGQERKDLARHLNLPEARVKVWYQNRRTKHKRLINEDENSCTNEIDHQNESDISNSIIKHDDDDEDTWNNEENDYDLDVTHEQDKTCSD
ncbi:unnamed protein product [Adineta steineri]|uniref:Homeobox domain-containing protein n=2 Tax=Adineta steineri TaxID=433720 RepID=A0A814MX06_9BILA|nr:unnamed protein product [Adineta steineri]